MHIEREIETKIKPYLLRQEILAIVGPRRVGKTTLMESIFQSWGGGKAFLTFEDRDLLDLFERDPKEFVARYVRGKSLLCIDEFQYAKNGGKTLKFIYDTEKIKIIVSGSSAIELTVQALGKLTGRVLTFEMFPFSFSEFLRFKMPSLAKKFQEFKRDSSCVIDEDVHVAFKAIYDEFLKFGAYPQVVLTQDEEEKKTILKSIYSTYFLREVRTMINLVDDRKLHNLIRVVALQNGGLLNYSELCKMSGVTFETLKRYLRFLEQTYIIKLVIPFHKNRQLELIKSPKLYFLDTGLLNTILDDFRGIKNRDDRGTLLENGVFSEFIKRGDSVQFWRTKDKKEIDFVVGEGNRSFRAYEVKYKDQTLTSAFYDFQNIYRKIPIQMLYFEGSNLGITPLSLPVYLS